jgi:hypothetical protein
VRDQLQELGDFGLKGKCLFFHGERVGDDGPIFQGAAGQQAPESGLQSRILFRRPGFQQAQPLKSGS